MNEHRIERIIYLTVIFVLFICLIVIVMLNSFNLPTIDFMNPIWSPLSTFLGALIGAGITGGIALYITEKDKKYRKDEKKEEVIDNYNKSFELIKMWSNSYLITYKEIYNLSLETNPNWGQLQKEIMALKECVSRFETINDDYIPAKVYKNFLDLKSLIELTRNLSSAYFESLQLDEPAEQNFRLVEATRYLQNSYTNLMQNFKTEYYELENFHKEINE